MKSLAICRQKGGARKTATVHLAHSLAVKGYDTVIIDLDPQGGSKRTASDQVAVPRTHF